ncbi:hypothetical protein HY256_04030 [Candidatus Sumerlaeota bacterium]|nr:hypothetical protein [Candidatus Sumerlaeota bacterium]
MIILALAILFSIFSFSMLGAVAGAIVGFRRTGQRGATLRKAMLGYAIAAVTESLYRTISMMIAVPEATGYLLRSSGFGGMLAFKLVCAPLALAVGWGIWKIGSFLKARREKLQIPERPAV